MTSFGLRMARCGTKRAACSGRSAATCRTYPVGAAGGSTKLDRAFEIALPTEGGHDLVAIPGSAPVREHRPALFLFRS